MDKIVCQILSEHNLKNYLNIQFFDYELKILSVTSMQIDQQISLSQSCKRPLLNPFSNSQKIEL